LLSSAATAFKRSWISVNSCKTNKGGRIARGVNEQSEHGLIDSWLNGLIMVASTYLLTVSTYFETRGGGVALMERF
jgi:hypothetical protein